MIGVYSQVRNELIFDIFLDVTVCVDIFMNFHAFYYDRRNMLVTSTLKIKRHYLTTWFAVDLLSILPIDMVVRPHLFCV